MEQDKGFTVSDRRSHGDDGEARPEVSAESAPGSDSADQAGDSPPSETTSGASEQEAAGEGFSMSGEAGPIDFSAFVFSLAHSAMIYMGLENHPETGKPEVNLPAARQNIDILSMLGEKTRGNLTSEEDDLIEKLLYTLRLSFVEVSKTNPSG
ncbi:MAG: DUF1844 domain-containing protein [Leptospirillia bacterium]